MRAAWRLGTAVGGAAGAFVLMHRRTRALERQACADLHDLVCSLPMCHGISDTLASIERVFVDTFGYPLMVLTLSGEQLCVRYHSSGFKPNSEDLTAAQAAITSETTLRRFVPANSEYTWYLPLTSWRGVIGVFAFQAPRRTLTRGAWRLIECFVQQTSLAVLRATSESQAKHADLLSEADRFQKALLNAVAHNVRTPLASVIGGLSALQQDDAIHDPEVRAELLDTALAEAERLNRLLGNLLDLSRLESGVVQMRADPCDVQDVIGAALEQLSAAARKRPITVCLAPGLPLVRMDFVLIVQVLVNVLDNAFKYSSPGTPVVIEARAPANALEICISDEGDGVAECDLVAIFDKFNRAGRTAETGGIGLGLSICRGLIEAHHGTIRAERRDPRGTAVTFTIPMLATGKVA